MEIKIIQKEKLPFFILLFLFLLIVQLVIVINSAGKKPKTAAVAKAQETRCPYPSGIAPVGSNIAANNNPNNYVQLRQLYNAQNPPSTGIQNCYIPVTVVYDLFFLKGGSQGIAQNLQAMAKNRLFPIIRVASYTGGGNVQIKLYPPTDASIMGENLGKALEAVKKDFPAPPIVEYLNEVNLHAEWGGKSSPEEFAESFQAFYQGLSKGSSFAPYFPPLSYGATGGNGIVPQEFINRFFASKKFTGRLTGVALNIYGSDYQDIAAQFASQLAALGLEASQIPTVITELGPVRGGKAVANCEGDKEGWEVVAGPIAAGVIKNKLTLATMACFGPSITYPAVVHYDTTAPQLISLTNIGQIENKTVDNANNQPQTQTPAAATLINFNPQNPSPNADFRVVISSTTGYTWVHLKIFDKDGKNLVQEASKKGDQPKVSRAGGSYQWTYDAQGLPSGDYKVVFYISCDRGCKEQASRTLAIGIGKTNETQTATTTTAQQQPQQTKTTTASAQSNTQPSEPLKPAIIRLPSPGKITLDLSAIDPIDPSTLEYCQKPQTSNAGCRNPHDQRVEDGTVTMSFPNGNPLIFCGSIPPARRGEVGGSDRKCLVFFAN